MAEVFGAIMSAIGSVLAAIYDAVPSYALAIVLLTIAVRVVMIPLTVKQIRSMAAMQRIQPEIKRIQQQHKGDRQKLNEEMMKVYKEHNVNPVGGCFPLLLQAPVFIALFSVLRAATPAAAIVPETATVPVEAKSGDAFCRPDPVQSPSPSRIVCDTKDGKRVEVTLGQGVKWVDPKTGQPRSEQVRRALRRCSYREDDGAESFVCSTQVGTGHLPTDSDLFNDIVGDRTKFLGMEMACSPTQSGSTTSIRHCAPEGTKGGGVTMAPYYLLVLLMVGTTYYQQRQIQRKNAGTPQPPQAQMIAKVMPFFLGFISLSIPAGVIVYWVVSNLWTIGQQAVVFRAQSETPGAAPQPDGKAGGKPQLKAVKPQLKGGEGKSAKAGPKRPNAKGNGGKPSGSGGGQRKKDKRKR